MGKEGEKAMKRCRKENAWIGILALLFSLLAAVPEVYGAGGIDTGRACTADFRLDGQYPELEELSVLVKLYQAASVGENGRYIPQEGFASLDFPMTGGETTARDWEKLAEQAWALAESGNIHPAAELLVQKQPGEEYASGRAEGLAPGMYLVRAESVQSAEHIHHFIPYLIALPDNYYAENGNDAWVYEVESELKPEQQERLGSLVIEKKLTAYNATFGRTSFVFQIEAEKDGKSVYSDVVSLAFDKPGVKSLQIDNIPAGAVVEVTEVYSGASYTAVTAPRQTAVIEAEGEDKNPAKVEFENTYDGHPNGGFGIVNHFKYGDGVWTPEQQRDST